MAVAPSRPSLFSAPALRALFIQISSFLLVLAIAWALAALADVQLSIAAAALLQGAIAALVTRRLSFAPWWPVIQAVFPVALLVVGALRLPPWIYLSAFLLFVCLYWTTFRTQVPFFPSSRATWEAVVQLLPAEQVLKIVDIGSGFGGFVMHLAATRPESEVCGIEVAPLPWVASVLRGRLRRSRGRFLRGDYALLDLAGYDVVFAYLSPAAMPALWRKANAEMAAGSLLISHEFSIPGAEPDRILQPAEGEPPLYVWRMT